MSELQCRDGDLAVITRDEPGLETNLGRLLWVYGPVLQHPELGPVWETRPATEEPMPFIDEDGKVRCDHEGRRIIHPDAWMRPVSMPEFDGQRPPRVGRIVPFTREWLAAAASVPAQVYLKLPSLKSAETVRLTGRQLRSRVRTQLCIPVQEDYGEYAIWFWFPGRSLSATAHWWVHEGTPELIGRIYGAADDAADRVYRELCEDKSLPWVFADGDWNSYMVLPARQGINVIPKFARGTIDGSDCAAVKSARKRKGSVFRCKPDIDWHQANWRMSQAVAACSGPETYLDDLERALREGTNSLPVLHA